MSSADMDHDYYRYYREYYDRGDALDERYLIDRAEHEAHAEANDEEPDDVCGETYEHNWRPGDPECRRCNADLSAWNDEETLPEICDECETRGINCPMHSRKGHTPHAPQRDRPGDRQAPTQQQAV